MPPVKTWRELYKTLASAPGGFTKMKRFRLRWRVLTGGIHIVIEQAEPRYQQAGVRYSARLEGLQRHFIGSTEASAIGNLFLELGESFGFRIEKRQG